MSGLPCEPGCAEQVEMRLLPFAAAWLLQRSKRSVLAWDCQAELFRQEVEDADDIRLDVRLFKGTCRWDIPRAAVLTHALMRFLLHHAPGRSAFLHCSFCQRLKALSLACGTRGLGTDIPALVVFVVGSLARSLPGRQEEVLPRCCSWGCQSQGLPRGAPHAV